jgi:hypothetical protein
MQIVEFPSIGEPTAGLLALLDLESRSNDEFSVFLLTLLDFDSHSNGELSVCIMALFLSIYSLSWLLYLFLSLSLLFYLLISFSLSISSIESKDQ